MLPERRRGQRSIGHPLDPSYSPGAHVIVRSVLPSQSCWLISGTGSCMVIARSR